MATLIYKQRTDIALLWNRQWPQAQRSCSEGTSGTLLIVIKIILFAMLLSSLPGTFAQTSGGSNTSQTIEKGLKAASLVHFLGYVEWPASSNSDSDPYTIGVVGADDIAGELIRITPNRRINNRPVEIRRLQSGDSVAGVEQLFIGFTDVAKVAPWVKRVQQQPILVITQAEGALSQGSMINFRIVDDRVRFDIAPDTAERAGLRISSRMLGVALQVVRGAMP